MIEEVKGMKKKKEVSEREGCESDKCKGKTK